ncbi:MAG: hypothetical protein JNG85_13735, partial [Spirochaetaceae bacterium]|nr:hypothetical protein [Spirochaetaceae bacterium]
MDTRSHFRRAAAILAAGLFSAFAATAQDGDFDPFDTGAFQESVSQSLAPGGAASASYLAGGSLLLRSGATLPAGLDGYAGGAGLSGRLFAKANLPDVGAFFVSYNASLSFLSALAGSGDARLAPTAGLDEPDLALAELHWSFDLGKRLFVRLGKQLISWGPSRVWTPVDFVNRERGSSLQALDLRAGKPGLRLHAPLGKANAFLFADFSRTVEGGIARDPLEAVALAARLDATLGDFELGLTGWTGAPVQDRLGFDFSGRLFGSSLYGEMAWAPALDQDESSLLGSLGFSRNLGELKRLTLSGEFFYNSAGDDGSAPISGAFT